MAAFNTTNTSTFITFNSTNSQQTAKPLYLYRFTYPNYPPNILGSPTSGVFIENWSIAGNTTANFTSVQDPSLNANGQYIYALYNGDSSNSIILTTFDGTPKTLDLYTPAVYNTLLNATQILPTSVTIQYNLNNSVGQDAGTTVYLYRYNSTSAPIILDSSGVQRISIPLSPGQVSGVQGNTDTTVQANNNYTYAFYDGSVNGVNRMLLSASGGFDVSYTVQTFYNVVVGLSSFNTTNTTTDISYTLRSTLTEASTSYLYRFDGSVDPSNILNNNGCFLSLLIMNALS
jgi:hypothetical protein